MRKTLIIALCCVSMLHGAYASYSVSRLIPALILVESGGNDKAVGDSGKAYGVLQIWNVVILDVNRIYKTKYTHLQMFDRYSSCEVAELYLRYWGEQYEKRTGKKATYEVWAKIWNGGPKAMEATGKKKENLDKYWKKVRKTFFTKCRSKCK